MKEITAFLEAVNTRREPVVSGEAGKEALALALAINAAMRQAQPAMNNPKIMLVAGEASGDQHAARLGTRPPGPFAQAKFFGIGGEALAHQGMRLACHAEDLAVIGLTEVFHKIPTIWRALQALWRYLRDERPDLVILVDFPDFNFLVLRLARRFRVPVMYYISPQVWAWRRGRVKTIARLVNRMVVIFPLEEEFYRQHGVAVIYVGHPLLETLPALPPRAAVAGTVWYSDQRTGGGPAARQPLRRDLTTTA